MRPLLILILLSSAWMSLAQPAANVWEPNLGTDEQHPCLMFGPEDIPAIKERLARKPYSDWWSSVQGDSNMVSQAFTYLMTGDAEKAEAVRQNLLRAYPSGYHCSCGVASPLQGCAEAYDMIYDYEGLTPEDHRVIRTKLAAACERMYLSALESSSGQHPGNQRTRGVCALGTAALVLRGYEDAEHTPAQWLQRALDGIRQEANLVFWREDGMFIEGPMYSSFTLSIMVPFARYYAEVTGNWLFDYPQLQNALLYLVYITQPDGNCAAIGTTNSGNMVNSLRLCIGAGDPRVQAFCRWSIEEWGSLAGGGVRDIGLFDDSIEPSTSGFATTRFFPTSQEAHIRSDWSRNAVALWFKGKDPWLARTHRVYSHGDVGSFVLHAYGEVLAVDAGYDHWVSYDLYPPELHNTLLVDGIGPVNETPGLLENALDAGFVQAGDIQSEYAGIAHRRSFVMIDGEYAIITDDITADDPHDYAWQIHTPVTRDSGTVEIDGNRARWTGFDPLSDRAGTVGVEAVWAGPVDVEPMEKSRWQPFSDDPQTASYDNWALVARQKATDTRYATVLYPTPGGGQRPMIETPAVEGARCITVSQGATRDTILALEGASASMGKVSTTARTCVVRERDGELDWFVLSAPGRLDYAGQRVIEVSETETGFVAMRVMGRTANATDIRRVFAAGPEGMAVALSGIEGVAQAFLSAAGASALAPLETSRGEGSLRLALSRPLPQGGAIALTSEGLRPSFDGAPPRPSLCSVDGATVPQREIVDMGRVATAPRQVTVRMSDEGAGIDPGSLRVTVDGVALPDAPDALVDGMHTIRLEEIVEETGHEVLARILDKAVAPNGGQVLLRFSMRPLLINGGFETGGERPVGWGLGAWSSNAETKYESRGVQDDPHSGAWCLMMRGIAGGLNMVSSQGVPFERGKTYRLTGYYRGDVAASISFCSLSGKNQYLWSPKMGPSEEWIPFEWSFTVTNPEDVLILAMRLGSVGTAYFDDLELDEIEPAAVEG